MYENAVSSVLQTLMAASGQNYTTTFMLGTSNDVQPTFGSNLPRSFCGVDVVQRGPDQYSQQQGNIAS